MTMRSAPVLHIDGLRKSYGEVEVLHGIDIDFGPGEFVGLMGPNGAGKSTLLKILAGLTPRGHGEIVLGGQAVQSLDGQSAVAFIHQDLGLIDQMTITENLRLGEAPVSMVGPLLDVARERRMAVEALARVEVERSPDTLVEELSPAEKALVAIARALSRDSTLLFVDEATSTLPPAEAWRVLDTLRSIVADGGTVILVTHKLAEVLDATERVVVIVDGRVVSDELTSSLDREALVKILVAQAAEGADPDSGPLHEPGEPALVLDDARAGGLGPINLTVARGEVVGLTGLPGSGLHDVAYLAAGTLPATSGAVRVPKGCKRGFVPPHRETQGGFPGLVVKDNLTISALPKWRRRNRLLSVRGEARAATEMVKRLSIHPPRTDAEYESLSGGNKQKVIFGRALFETPDVCVLCEPTRGVDAGTRAEIYRLIRALRDGGSAILVVSSDAEDLLSIADRVGVVVDGRVSNVQLTREMAPAELEELV